MPWRPTLDPAEAPIYQAIVAALARDIRAGRLRPGERLPAQRALAVTLGVNLTTVMRAIARAEQLGLVAGERGRGTFVRAGDPRKEQTESRTIDLTMNVPPVVTSPPLDSLLADTASRVVKQLGAAALLQYPERGGAQAERDAGVRWLSRRGLSVDPERLIVTSGTDHALLVALSAATSAGDTILTEDLTYPGIRSIAEMLGLRVVGVRCDTHGLDPDAFRAACRRKPKLLLCTPTLHNPTGSVLSAERRSAIVGTARRHGVRVLEDDVYGFLPADAPAPLAALAPDVTTYATSFSKCVAPGLRIGYLACTDVSLADRVAAVARSTTWTPSTLSSAITTRWIQDGTAATALASVRLELSARQKLAARVLAAFATRPHVASPHVWLTLPPGVTRGTFVERARRDGVAVLGADAFAMTSEVPEAVRICLGAAHDLSELESALNRLVGTLRGTQTLGPSIV